MSILISSLTSALDQSIVVTVVPVVPVVVVVVVVVVGAVCIASICLGFYSTSIIDKQTSKLKKKEIPAIQ